jgi:hypothetical protein
MSETTSPVEMKSSIEPTTQITATTNKNSTSNSLSCLNFEIVEICSIGYKINGTWIQRTFDCYELGKKLSF